MKKVPNKIIISKSFGRPDDSIISNKKVKNSGKDFRKVWYYFHKLIRSQKFNKDIAAIRNKYKIIPFIKPSGDNFFPYENKKQYDEVIELCSKYGLYFSWADSIIIIISYGLTKEVIIPKNFKEIGFCTVNEIKTSIITDKSKMKNEKIIFPISIKISPYASKEVIKNFIDKNYNKIIKPLQNRYANPDIDPRDIREKDDKVQAMQDLIIKLIYDEEMDIDSIKKIVNEKFDKNLSKDELSRMILRIKKYTQ